MKLKNLEELVQNPEPIDEKDRIIQLFVDERFHFYALLRSGRIMKKRARGQSGQYDSWKEIDMLTEIKEDLFPNAQ